MLGNKIKYDSEHDVLYIFLGEPRFGYEDEISPGVFLRKDEDSDEVIGAIIMNFTKKNDKFLQSIVPFGLNVSEIKMNYIH